MPKQQYLYKCPNHTANLNNMRLNNKWCDLTIIVNKKKYRAHKLILAANLKYFESMLSSDSFQENNQGVIIMEYVEDACGRSLEAIITYAYTGEILLTDSNALDLLEVANYFGEGGIKGACIKFLRAHLKVDQACRAYKFADTIDCQPLKNVAKKTILSNFGHCSETSDFLEFQCEQLVDILSDGQTMPAKSQQKFFERIMRWIMLDVKERSNRVNDLLNAIDIAKLTADDLTGCLLRNKVDSNDKYGIMRRTMVCYHKNKLLQRKVQAVTAEQSLIIIGHDANDKKFKLQWCDLLRNKWILPEEISGYNNSKYTSRSAAVFGDMLYYVGSDQPQNDHADLCVFDPATKQNAKLHSSSIILRGSVLCACSRFVYLCGGRNIDSSRTNRALRYDPKENSIKTLPPMKTKRHDAAAIYHQGCLYVLGGLDGESDLNSVEKYDPDTKKWTFLPSMCKTRGFHAVAELDGKLYVCGGMNNNSVEVYDPSTNGWQLVASMNKNRDKFLVIAHEGKLFAIGGNDDKSVEVYDPLKDEWQIDDELSSGLDFQYPLGGLILASGITNSH